MISALNERSQEIFRLIVDSFIETGEPVGSKTLARRLKSRLSPATIRNVMADLESSGLLFSPHTSAGRLPTDVGLRLFVDGLLEVGGLSEDDRQKIEQDCVGPDKTLSILLEQASATLSGLSKCASLVLAPKTDSPLRHIEFVNLSPGRALAVLVMENGVIENRVIETPLGTSASSLIEASNFLSTRLMGCTISEASEEIIKELASDKARLDDLTSQVVESGLAIWAGGDKRETLIVRGQANLLDDIAETTSFERIRALFEALERKETLLNLLERTDQAERMQIFIGADNQLFNMAGCSMIIGSYKNGGGEVIGAVGVIGPTRMNYARIIPMVDYTSKLIGRLIG
jgi:heat-inducible transcriptional repressor